jgi:Rrf2 family protein
MIELALHEGAGPLLLRQVAAAQHISPKYLEQLTMPLRRAGLLQAERGPQGGYGLARPAEQITAREIVEAVEGPLHLLDCLPAPKTCDRSHDCAARLLWGKVGEALAGVLERTTLAELRDQQRAAEQRDVPTYQI